MNISLRDAVRSSFVGPTIRNLISTYYRRQRLSLAKRLAETDKKIFSCPICQYKGLFVDLNKRGRPTRRYALCPNCGAAERHRLQAKVLDAILPDFAAPTKSALHFAPEAFFAAQLRAAFGTYKTADLFRPDMDIKTDICAIPVADNSFDLVYASHVLEHVPDDRKAIREIHRILRPGGVAVLPVPISHEPVTVEYGRALPSEDGHVRRPGLDYFDRYRETFDRVETYTSENFRSSMEDNQLFIIISRGGTPTRTCDCVPICHK